MNWRFLVLSVFYSSGTLLAADYTWTGISGGSYTTPGNWSPSGPPGSTDKAIFSSSVQTIVIPTSTSPVTGTLEFHASSTTINILPGASLTVGNGVGTGMTFPSGSTGLFLGFFNAGSNTSIFTLQSGSMANGSSSVSVFYEIDNGGTISIGPNAIGETGGANAVVTIGGVSGGTFQTANNLTISHIASTKTSDQIKIAAALTLSKASGVDSAIAGVVSDNGAAGSIIVNGGATLTLSNTSNSFTGGTIVNPSGTLAVPSGGCIGPGGFTLAGGTFAPTGAATSSSPVSITANSTINASGGAVTLTGTLTGSAGTILASSGNLSLNTVTIPSGTFTISGNLSGSQQLTKTGAGIVTLSGINTYSGGTMISAGILAISGENRIGGSSAGVNLAGGTLHATGNVSTSGAISVTDNSTLNTDPSFTTTFSGIVTGSNGKTLALSGANSLGAVAVNSTDSFTIGGVISGSQALTKSGTGTVILTGANTYTGGTIISAGTLNLSGSIAGNATVSPSAILKGIGSVGGSVHLIGGTIAPGNSPGTMPILGNFNVDNPSSIIAIEINAAGDTSLLQITGSANLNGNGILQVTADPGNYVLGTKYTILTATGGVVGEFASNNLTGLLPNVAASLIYNAQSIQILLSTLFNPLNLDGLSGNNLSVAKYLNTFPQGSLGSSFNTLTQLSENDLKLALSTISPSRNSADNYIAQATLLSCNSALNAHSFARRMWREVDTHQSELAQNGFISDQLLASAQNDVLMSSPEVDKNTPGSVWLLGFGDFATQSAQNQNPKFSATTGGAMLGFDYGNYDVSRFKLDAVVIGTALAFTHSDLEQSHHFGHSTINAGYLSLYGTAYWSNYYIDFVVWNGYEHSKDVRNVFFSGYSAKAKSSHNGYLGDVHTATGYDFHFKKKKMSGMFEPFISLDWVYNVEEGFKEQGAAPYNMQQKHRFSSMLQTEAGFNTYFSWICKKSFLNLRSKLSYINRNPFHVGKATINIVGAPGSFTVNSFTRNQSMVSPSVELAWRANRGSYISLLYDGEFGSGWVLNEFVGRIGWFF